jgi:hypothetical protein
MTKQFIAGNEATWQSGVRASPVRRQCHRHDIHIRPYRPVFHAHHDCVDAHHECDALQHSRDAERSREENDMSGLLHSVRNDEYAIVVRNGGIRRHCGERSRMKQSGVNS